MYGTVTIFPQLPVNLSSLRQHATYFSWLSRNGHSLEIKSDQETIANVAAVAGWMFLPVKQQSFNREKKNKQTENLYPLTCSCLELEYELLISCGYFVITKHVEKSQHTKDGSAEQEDVVESRSHVQLFCKPVDCRPPGLSVHEIFQPRILEWVAMCFSRGSS